MPAVRMACSVQKARNGGVEEVRKSGLCIEKKRKTVMGETETLIPASVRLARVPCHDSYVNLARFHDYSTRQQ